MADSAEKKRARDTSIAPTGAIFLGVAATSRLALSGDDLPKRVMDTAAKMKAEGHGERAIYAATNKMLEGSNYAGVSYDAAGKPRVELSDHNAKFDASGVRKSGMDYLGNALKHDKLHDAVGDGSRMTPVEPMPRHVRTDALGGYDGTKMYLGDRLLNPSLADRLDRTRPSAMGVALHEAQHMEQRTGGRPEGTNPSAFERIAPGAHNAEIRRGMYDSTAGEVEAEITRKSQAMTPAQRRAEHPDDRGKRFDHVARRDQFVLDAKDNMSRGVQDMRQAKPTAGQTTPQAASKWGKILSELPVDAKEAKRLAQSKGEAANKQAPRMMEMRSNTSAVERGVAKPGEAKPLSKKAALSAAKAELAAHRTAFENGARSDDKFYRNGGAKAHQADISAAEKKVADLSSKAKSATVADLRAQAKAQGITGASKMTKAALMDAVKGAAGSAIGKVGAVAMVAAPVAAAAVAYDATKNQALAAGQDATTAKGKAVAAGVVAGGVTAGVGYGIGKGIKAAFTGIAAVAPRAAPLLGPAGLALGAGMMAHGAYQGYQNHGSLKGAALGAIGADSLLDIGKGSARGLDADKAKQFETAASAFEGMQKAYAETDTSRGGGHTGWGAQARINAYKSRQQNAGKSAENVPYGGDATQAPGYEPKKKKQPI